MVARVARLKPKVTSDHARASIDQPAPWEPWDTDEHIRPPPEYHARTRPVSASMGRKCPPPKNNDRQTQPRTGTIRGLPYHAKEIRTMGLRPRPMSASMRRAALRSTRRGKVRPSSSTYLLVSSWDPGVFFCVFRPMINYMAMNAHFSQFVWYRRLFIVFSRYGYMNNLREYAAKDEEKNGVNDGADVGNKKKQE
eukprot:Stramenopile-MAST_4_protein_6566